MVNGAPMEVVVLKVRRHRFQTHDAAGQIVLRCCPRSCWSCYATDGASRAPVWQFVEIEAKRREAGRNPPVLCYVSLCADLAQPSTIGMPEAIPFRRSYPSF
jgi:hypothetical protein